MIKNPKIRKCVLDALKASIIDPSVTWFDGRPTFLEAADLPAVAVYLTDTEPTNDVLDEDQWRGVLHIEVFLKATSPDSALDAWVEAKIYPALNDIPSLADLIQTMAVTGYDYQRDDEMATWGSADLRYTITYTM